MIDTPKNGENFYLHLAGLCKPHPNMSMNMLDGRKHGGKPPESLITTQKKAQYVFKNIYNIYTYIALYYIMLNHVTSYHIIVNQIKVIYTYYIVVYIQMHLYLVPISFRESRWQKPARGAIGQSSDFQEMNLCKSNWAKISWNPHEKTHIPPKENGGKSWNLQSALFWGDMLVPRKIIECWKI